MSTASRGLLGALALAVALGAAAPAASAATAAPHWSIQALAAPTNFLPGEGSGLDTYEVFLTNSGGETTDHSQITIVDTLPKGVGVKSVALAPPRSIFNLGGACEPKTTGEVTTVSCKVTDALLPGREPAKLYPGDELLLTIHTTVPACPGAAESCPLLNEVAVKGGGAAEARAEFENEAIEDEGAEVPAQAGYEEFSSALTGVDGLAVDDADSHPYEYTSSFAVNLVRSPPGSDSTFDPAGGDLKEIEVALPPGLIANPEAVGHCTAQQFNTLHSVQGEEIGENFFPNVCPADSAVGLAVVQQLEGRGGILKAPIYNLTPPQGMPAQLGFEVAGAPNYIDAKVRSEGAYEAVGVLHNVTEAERATAAKVILWGTPWDESHDTLRGECAEVGGACPAEGGASRPFLRLPSSCDSPLLFTMSFETWAQPSAGASASDEAGTPVNCAAPDFSPEIEAKPTTSVADSPAGLRFELKTPQDKHEDPEGLGEADLRGTKVVLPRGLVVNPASADGLAACTTAQIGLLTAAGASPIHFDEAPARCPKAAKIGTVEAITPLLDHPIPGAVYLAAQGDNPFKSLLAIYIVLEDPESEVIAKLAGEVVPDPATGQLTTTVLDAPQVPVAQFSFNFFEGARAPLRTPATCGTHTTTTDLKPWTSPAFGPDATPSDSFQITQGAGGGSCPTTPSGEPNSPSFEAGTAAPVAGAFSPFILHLARQDGSQEIKGVNVDLPPGLTGKLAGLSYCSDGALASAASKSGKAEQGSPSCPSSSELGTVTVGAGAGPTPFYVQGKAYLAGPYKSAPISMAILTPAVAGPFDLGTVVVRAALNVDPETARIHALSDPIPTILQGIPLDVRSIALHVDRDQFTLNPTSCDLFAFSGQALSALGQSAALSSRFQVGGCSSLAFKPKLSLKLKGGTKRGDHPALTAVVRMPPGGANIASAQVALPHSEFLDQAHIKTICTRVQFAANACPSGSIYGYAKAVTPLLDQPLEGPVYLRSSSHNLPDVVADLNGQIHVVLDGRVDSIHGGIRNTFESVPDAPVSKFTLSLKGGKKGLLINSRDICGGTNRANADFTAQSGKASDFKLVLKAKCKNQRKRRRR